MIPVRLSLRNFMCYRDNVPPLDFTGIHLACLWGDNGNGKSAIIDAITWALWGKSRAKSDDDLIYATQSEMEVVFDFAAGGQTYRIIRKRSKPKRARSAGLSSLDLYCLTGDSVKSMSGDIINQTQQKIIDLLHMDYDTFVNSAYLRQGHADEFTVRTPAKRKEVLANILGLSFYDELETQARSLLKDQDAKKDLLENAIRDIDAELANQPAYEAALTQAQSELTATETALAEKESKLKTLRQQKEALALNKSQLDELQARLENTRKDLALWQEPSRQRRSRIHEYEAIISERSAIAEGYRNLIEARKLYEELDKKARQAVSLERRKMQLESKIQQAVSGISAEHTMTQRKIQELENKAARLPELKSHLQQIHDRLRRLAGQEEALKNKRQAFQEAQEQIVRLESANLRLEQEISEAAGKFSLLAAQTEAKCPLCGTELSVDGIQHIESRFTEEKRQKSESIQSNLPALAQHKSNREALSKEISQIEIQMNQEKTAAQGKAGVLENQISDAESAGKERLEQQQYLAEIEQRLVSREFTAVEDRLLAGTEDELARLAYDHRQHDTTRQSVAELTMYELSQRKLEEADRLLPQEREYALQAEAAEQKARHALETDEQKRKMLSDELTALPETLAALAQTESENQQFTRQRNRVQEAMGGIKAKLQRCAELAVTRKEKETTIAAAVREESIYRELAEAFGKGGIPALLIEKMALPEIEIEANRLLSRMTDNRMHLKFESQRETKTGGVIETLDIKISDELGIRDYEMFSGGEAFRINFAVRIALSRLLAKRAGAPLRTLIIDEGFGTQDNAGIEKLKEAINSIQDDFDKIIVITHIEELRDAFPTRIDVTRTADGSMISVN